MPVIRRLRTPRGYREYEPRTLVMGIVNVTPDSFHDGGLYLDPGLAERRVWEMIDQGVDIVDIGGVSTRPGAKSISLEEERRRVAPILKRLGSLPAPISIDTTSSEVARLAVDQGATIINDISAGRWDPGMAELMKSDGDIQYVVMHMQGKPATMQRDPTYDDVVSEVTAFLRQRIDHYAEVGIERDRIWVDPGIGFGKRLDDNLALLRSVPVLRQLGSPVLIGHSHKSFMSHLLGVDTDHRLFGSIAVSAIMGFVGADVIRVHDVTATRHAVILAQRLRPDDGESPT